MLYLISTVFIPFVIALTVILIGERNDKLRNVLIMIMPFYNLIGFLANSAAILAGKLPVVTIADLGFFTITFRADPLALLMGTLVTFLWVFTSSYSIGYMQGEHALPRYFASLTVCLGATMGIILAANLFTLFLFYEMLGFAVYPLVIHIETEEAFKSGVVYLLFLLVGGSFLLFGIILTYVLTKGNITFVPGGMAGLADGSQLALYSLFFMFLIGFGVKSAIMPLHVWLPRAMIAPTPISALLHAVAVVNMGLYGMIRMIYNVFGPALFGKLHLDIILAVPACITIIFAAIAALRVDKIKRLLAYSTINQLSYVILGAASLHAMAFMGALVHIVYHSVMKITLFYSAGTIIKQTGKVKIKEMSGLAKKMPVTCAAFTVGALGIAGLPPIAGWISKWYMVEGFLKIGNPWLASVYIISSIIEIGFLTPPILYAYFGKDEGKHSAKAHPADSKYEAPLDMLIPLAVVAILSITFGLFGSLPFVYGTAAVENLLATTVTVW